MTRFILVALCGATLSFSSAVSDNRKGNKLFKEKKYDEAARRYAGAEIAAPEEKAIPYNLGNARYRAGDFAGAVQALEKAKKAGDPLLKKKALFNLGNSHYRAGENPGNPSAGEHLKSALESYKEVLKLDPGDRNAKFNLEMTLRKMEQQKQQQQSGKDQDEKGDQKQQGNDPSKQGDQDAPGDSARRDDEQARQQEGKDGKEKDQQAKGSEGEESRGDSTGAGQAQAPPPKPGEMSEEQARALLQSLQKDEEEWQKKRMKKLAGTARAEKDW